MNRAQGLVLMGVMGASLGQAFAQTGWFRDYAALPGAGLVTGNAFFMTGTKADNHWLFKIDPATGDSVWSRNLHDGMTEFALGIGVLSDGGLVTWGNAFSPSSYYSISTQKIDPATGRAAWSRSYCRTRDCHANKVLPLAGGNHLVLATTANAKDGFYQDAWALAFGANGDTLWSAVYEPDGFRIFFQGGWPTADGGAVLSLSDNDGHWDLLRLDSRGHESWRYRVGWDAVSDVSVAADGSMIATGANFAYDGTGRDWAKVRKLDKDGKPVWEKSWASEFLTVNPFRISAMPDGGFLILGSTSYQDYMGQSDLLLARFDSRGETVWIRTLGGWKSEWPQDIQAMPDGSILITARTESTESKVPANWLISVATDGEALWNRVLPAAGSGAGSTSEWVPGGDGGGFLLSGYGDGVRARRILPDLRAEMGKPFAYTLPLSDSGSFQLKALYLPAGMELSSSGTLTWTPSQGDFGFSKAAIEATTRGSKDTLTLNIWINWQLKPAGYHQDLATPVRPSSAPRPANSRNRLGNSALSPLPSGTRLFDLRGRNVSGRTREAPARGIYGLRVDRSGAGPNPGRPVD